MPQEFIEFIYLINTNLYFPIYAGQKSIFLLKFLGSFVSISIYAIKKALYNKEYEYLNNINI